MRILYHHRTLGEDAQGVHIAEIAKAFRDRGHSVETRALVATTKTKRRIKLLGLLARAPRWIYELTSLLYNFYGYCVLVRAARATRAGLIYERYSLNTFCGIWASRRLGIPLVLEVNAPLYLEQKQLGELALERFARFSERWICSRSSWTIVVSDAMKRLLVDEGVPPEKIVVMPNGVDPRTFHPGVPGEPVRRRYGIDAQPVIGFVGWFRKWHGVELLLEAAHELKRRDVKILLVGDGPAFPDLHRLAQDRGLLESVIFTGPVARLEIPAHVAAMDIAVQPSATEYACPLKLIEYMAMKKCVLAPDQPNIREIIENGVTGSLFTAGDRDSLRRALVAALADSTARNRMAQNAWESVFERGFLWEANVDRTLELVSEPPNVRWCTRVPERRQA